MSPAVTRATAASAQSGSEPTLQPDRTPSSASEDPTADDRGVARTPFIPKRKPVKPTPYAYLVTETSNSVDSLPIRDVPAPARPASALEPVSYTSHFSPAQQKQARDTLASGAPATRTFRSVSRSLAPPTTPAVTASAPVSAANTPRLRPQSTFARNPFATEELASRPRSLTPTIMAARTAPAAAPSTPRIKAAVSAEVAARIRSPKKHASTSALRATASYDQRQAVNSRSTLSQAQPQSTREAERLAEAYAHSSSTWQQNGDASTDGEPAGDSSFVYDAEADTQADAGGQETVQVHVRLRPPKRGEDCAWVANPYSGTVALEASIASGRTQSANLGPFTFDGIQTGSANRPVYISVARPLVRAALDGYDAVVFAYGQTASGKTFTLSGDEKGQEAGIIPRAVRDIFRGIQQSSARREYLLRASYLEIWNEVVKDLLEPSNVPQVRDDKRKRGGKGTTVQPLREEIVTSPAQVRELLARGQANRHVGATDWNERSSRSHTCFKITIESWERDALSHDDVPSPTSGEGAGKLGKKVTVSELCLIDLAGSEKYVSQGSDRRAEGAHINKSLLTLGKVIFALSEKSGNGVHIPYRDSKLTRILQNSLSGNARVAVVCTINPNPSAVDESLSTLNFAKRIKKVGLHARRNEVDGSMGGLGAEAQALILRYQTEADALRKMVQELQKQGPTQVQEVAVDDERIRELQERLDVIGSLVVRGGRAHDSEMHRNGAGVDSGDEEDDEPGQLRTPSGSGSTISTLRSGSHSTPATSRSTSQSSCITNGASAYARPVSPVKRSSAVVANYVFGFDDPPAILAEKLFLANRKIEALSRRLAARPSLPSTDEAQMELIAHQQQQIRELEAVCEAQAQDAPPKIREDVEREFAARLAELERKLDEKDCFIAELQAESTRLRRANAQLMELAHQQTQDMVENLASPQRKPGSPLKSSDAANARRRGMLEGSPTKPRQRPMSLFDPTPSELAKAFGEAPGARGSADRDIGKKVAATPAAAANSRRSISNDYTLLKLGTQHIEEEIDLRSATIPASETFAALPGVNLASLSKAAAASVGPTIAE